MILLLVGPTALQLHTVEGGGSPVLAEERRALTTASLTLAKQFAIWAGSAHAREILEEENADQKY